ncbi:MAG: hypothetical protein H7067_19700, partial [Burkholderiales bacterium]|nr:hypothetical protein [Opitutaceae bacterium]
MTLLSVLYSAARFVRCAVPAVVLGPPAHPMLGAAARGALWMALSFAAIVPARAAEYFVAPSGEDTADGSEARPFATLERAREAVRSRGNRGNGVTIWMEPGTYPVTKTLELSSADGGSASAPIAWRARKDGTAVLDAGRRLAAKDFVKVDDSARLARMAEEARGQVWQIDLRRLGVRHTQRPPDLFEDGGGLFELYCDSVRQPLSRWPNDANTTIARVLDAGDSSKGKRTEGATFAYREERPARWAEAAQSDQLWLAGYWRVPWEYRVARVKRLDPEQKTITLAKAFFMGIGSKYAGPEGAGTEPWRAVNLLEE